MDIDNLTRDQLIEILHSLKDENIQVVDRDKNFAFRTLNNITITELKAEIRALEVRDIHRGPVADDNPDRDHPVWIFIKNLFNKRCYIKIKIINKGRVAIVISFHEAKYP